MADIKASIDIGDNLTKLLEKLAQQIGTTADKVFPWYVKQQIYEGWLYVLINILFLIIAIVGFSIGMSKFLKTDAHVARDEEKRFVYGLSIVIFGVILAASILAFVMGFGDNLTKIMNPEYHALQKLIKDLASIK